MMKNIGKKQLIEILNEYKEQIINCNQVDLRVSMTLEKNMVYYRPMDKGYCKRCLWNREYLCRQYKFKNCSSVSECTLFLANARKALKDQQEEYKIVNEIVQEMIWKLYLDENDTVSDNEKKYKFIVSKKLYDYIYIYHGWNSYIHLVIDYTFEGFQWELVSIIHSKMYEKEM